MFCNVVIHELISAVESDLKEMCFSLIFFIQYALSYRSRAENLDFLSFNTSSGVEDENGLGQQMLSRLFLPF